MKKQDYENEDLLYCLRCSDETVSAWDWDTESDCCFNCSDKDNNEE